MVLDKTRPAAVSSSKQQQQQLSAGHEDTSKQLLHKRLSERAYNACLTQSAGLPISVHTWLRTVDEASKSNVIR